MFNSSLAVKYQISSSKTFKFQYSKTKLQINLKFQYSMTKTSKLTYLDFFKIDQKKLYQFTCLLH